MPIVARSQLRFDAIPTDEAELIGWLLGMASMLHAREVLGTRVGLSYGSCNAAVAITSNAAYFPLGTGSVAFSAAFGNSRLFTGLDPSFNAIHAPAPDRPFSISAREEHAEQVAIQTARSAGLTLLVHNGSNHIYIDLEPCDSCEQWLRNDSASWHVHYFCALGNQSPAQEMKKDFRKAEYGRVNEPRPSGRA